MNKDNPARTAMIGSFDDTEPEGIEPLKEGVDLWIIKPSAVYERIIESGVYRCNPALVESKEFNGRALPYCLCTNRL